MNSRAFDFLQKLLNTPSPSGFEELASELWREYVKESFDLARVDHSSVTTDVYGNSIARLGEDRAKILMCGHIDEVGMMINYISDDGFLYISQIGGVEAAILPAQRVVVHSTNGPVSGVIGRRPPHLEDEEEDEIKFHNVFVDIGAVDRDDALNYVSVGDPITFDASFYPLINNMVVGRGIDDRVGAWVVARVMEELAQKSDFTIPIVGAATIQEENGMYGATMVAKSVDPSIAIAIDVAHVTDVPDISKEKHGDCSLGKGPVLSVGSVIHKKVNLLLEQAARETYIPLQKQISPCWTGTDADALFTKNGGIATGLVGIPNRYMHSPVEMISLEDLENAVKLIVRCCELVNSNAEQQP